MTTPKAILIVGAEGLERVHILHREGESEKAMQFYQSIVPSLEAMDEIQMECAHLRSNRAGDPIT